MTAKPVWNKLYSVASPSWNHFLWVDPSLFFDCPEGLEKAKTYLNGDDMVMLWTDSNPNSGVYLQEVIICGMKEWWLAAQIEATRHIEDYCIWQKKYGSNG